MMDDFDKRKADAWEAHRKEFDCECLFRTLRRRTIANGSIQIVSQCLSCGRSVGNPIKRTPEAEANATPWDQSIFDSFEAKRRDSAAEIKRLFDRSAFFDSYDKYLASPEWSAKRDLVMKRAGGVCEGCGINKADEVHHLSYANVGNEFLFELVAVCHPCHVRIHEEKE